MADTKQPDDSHRVGRHCYKKNHFADDERTILTSDVFKLRDGEPYLSVNWLEYRDGNDEARIAGVWSDIQKAGRTVKKNKDRLGVINIGRAKAIGSEFGAELLVTHEPINDNKSHSALWGIDPDGKDMQQELAEFASRDLRPFSE